MKMRRSGQLQSVRSSTERLFLAHCGLSWGLRSRVTIGVRRSFTTLPVWRRVVTRRSGAPRIECSFTPVVQAVARFGSQSFCTLEFGLVRQPPWFRSGRPRSLRKRRDRGYGEQTTNFFLRKTSRRSRIASWRRAKPTIRRNWSGGPTLPFSMWRAAARKLRGADGLGRNGTEA